MPSVKRTYAARIARLDEEIAELDRLSRIAEAGSERNGPNYGAAVQARSRWVSLRAERERVELAATIDKMTDALERLRAQRSLALMESSWQAVQRFEEMEAEVLRERAEAQRVRDEAERRANSASGVHAAVEAAKRLPPSVQAAVLAALAGQADSAH